MTSLEQPPEWLWGIVGPESAPHDLVRELLNALPGRVLTHTTAPSGCLVFGLSLHPHPPRQGARGGLSSPRSEAEFVDASGSQAVARFEQLWTAVSGLQEARAALSVLVCLCPSLTSLDDAAERLEPLALALQPGQFHFYCAPTLLPMDLPAHDSIAYHLLPVPETPWLRWLPETLRLEPLAVEPTPGTPLARFGWQASASAIDLPFTLTSRRVLRDGGLETQLASAPQVEGETPDTSPLYCGDQLQLVWHRPAAEVLQYLLLLQPLDGEGDSPVWQMLDISGTLRFSAGQTSTLLDAQRLQARPILLLWRGDALDSGILSIWFERLQEETRSRGLSREDEVRLLGHWIRDHLLSSGLEDAGFSVYSFAPIRLAGRRPTLSDPPLHAWLSHLEQGELAPLLDADKPFELQGLPPVLQLEGRLVLAVARRRSGQLEQAEAALRSIRAEALAQHCPHIAARASRELGRCLLDADRLDSVQEILQESITALDALHDPLEAARSRMQLALLPGMTDRFEEALELYQQIETPARQAGDLTLLANALEGQGQSFHDLGREWEARQAHTAAAELFTRLGDPMGQLRIAGDLANLEYEFGHPQESLVHALRQLELSQPMQNGRVRGIVRFNVGRAWVACGQAEKAIPILEESIQLLPEPVAELRRLGAVLLAEGLLLLGNAETALEWLNRFAPVGPDTDGTGQARERLERQWQEARVRGNCLAALQRVEEATGVYEAGLESLNLWRTRLTRPARAYALERSVRLQTDYIRHILRTSATSEAVFMALERSRAQGFVEALTAQSAQHTAPEFTLAQARTRLPESLQVWSFFWLEDHLLVCRLTAQEAEHRVISVDPEAFRRARESLELGFQQIPISSPVIDALKELSALLLEPFGDWLGKAPATGGLCVVEHGALHHVPWQALPMPQDHAQAGKPLGAVLSLFRSPSLRALWLLNARSHEAELPALPALLMADPEGDLPFSREEVFHLARSLEGCELRVGEAATREALQGLGPQAQLLHLSMHAEQLAPDQPPALRLADGLFPEPVPHSSAPAGAAHAPESLQFRADLVVLSVCSAIAGPLLRSSESPDLLPQRFLQAGARAVLASAWPIADEALSAFFECFYDGLRARRSLAEALLEAQRHRYQQAVSLEEWLAGPGAFSLFGSGLHLLEGFVADPPAVDFTGSMPVPR